jgi:UDP-N-acetylglucosamine 1-carboxyvinyltransferase
VRTVRTMPYPGFPTDIQPPVTAMLCAAAGTSVVIETIFESRFRYAGELTRFGAKIRTEGRMAVVEGVERLFPAQAAAPDLRGGAALVLAALAAEGESRVSDVRHIDRGYQNLEQTLQALRADITRID